MVSAFCFGYSFHISLFIFNMQMLLAVAMMCISISSGFLASPATLPVRAATRHVVAMAAGVDSGTAQRERMVLVVSGEVHGGYYRAAVRNEAVFMRSLGVTVRELSATEGTGVPRCELTVEGKRSKLESFMAWCGRPGSLISTERGSGTNTIEVWM